MAVFNVKVFSLHSLSRFCKNVLHFINLHRQLFKSLYYIVKGHWHQGQGHYNHCRVQVAKSLAPLIILFATCWLPLHIMNTMTLHGANVDYPALLFAILLSHVNSIANPVLYGMSNSKFRVAFKIAVLRRLDLNLTQFSTYDTSIAPVR